MTCMLQRPCPGTNTRLGPFCVVRSTIGAQERALMGHVHASTQGRSNVIQSYGEAKLQVCPIFTVLPSRVCDAIS
eukprot:3398070-Amphidinium_carterae.1